MGLTLNLKKPEETPSENPLLQETFDEMKKRVFNRNYQKLLATQKKFPKEFINLTIRKYEGLRAQVLGGGEPLLNLVNHEVVYYQNSEIAAFLKQYITESVNDPGKDLE